MLEKHKCKQLIERVCAVSKADEVDVNISGTATHHLRYARNMPTNSGTVSDRAMTVTSTFGRRSGTASVNQFDEASIQTLVARAEELAQLAPEDPEHVSALGPQSFPVVNSYRESVETRGPVQMAKGVRRCIEDSRENGLVVAGYAEGSASYSAIGSSNGLFGFHRTTTAHFSETARTSDGTGSGWSSGVGNDVEEIDFGASSATAIGKALASREPRELAPGKYPAILEPACVASLVGTFMWGMSTRRADEGRSFFSKEGGGNRRGEKLLPDNITIYSDPLDSLAPGSPWGRGGLPQTARRWVDRGTLANLPCSRFWAQKQGVNPVPRPGNMIMEGGSGTLAELIASTERAVLITSLWYIRSVDPRTMLLTGLTRDGVFMVENGKIAYPLTNFRWNDSPVRLLRNVDSMSATVRVSPRGWPSAGVAVPALRVRERATSVSEAV